MRKWFFENLNLTSYLAFTQEICMITVRLNILFFIENNQDQYRRPNQRLDSYVSFFWWYCVTIILYIFLKYFSVYLWQYWISLSQCHIYIYVGGLYGRERFWLTRELNMYFKSSLPGIYMFNIFSFFFFKFINDAYIFDM